MVERTMFLKKVCQLEMTKASPKHPQSVTGFAIAIYKVNGVIIAIKRSDKIDVFLILQLNKKLIPIINSMAQRRMAAGKASPERMSIPKASK
jgi:hypothetical protein